MARIIARNKKPFGSLKTVMKEVSKRVVKAGHFKEAGNHWSGYSFAELMEMHEVGMGDLPSRPVYLMAGILLSENIVSEVGGDIKDFIGKGETSALDKVGEFMQDEIKSVFGDLSMLREKAPSTKKRSKSPDTPLVETGELRDAVRYKVE